MASCRMPLATRTDAGQHHVGALEHCHKLGAPVALHIEHEALAKQAGSKVADATNPGGNCTSPARIARNGDSEQTRFCRPCTAEI